jgi:hypothetical protein
LHAGTDRAHGPELCLFLRLPALASFCEVFLALSATPAACEATTEPG